MKQKTALEELTEAINLVNTDTIDKNKLLALIMFIYLPKEKQQIQDAFEKGMLRDNSSAMAVSDILAKEYFNQTYNNN